MTWSLVLPFDNDDEMFVRGFELGGIWEKLKSNPDSLDGQMFHAVNSEMVIRMLENIPLPYTYHAVFTEDPDWMMFKRLEGT